jgi:hypothetical protein
MGNEGDEYFESGFHFHMDKIGCIDVEKSEFYLGFLIIMI